MKVKSESEVAQSYPTLSDPMDCSPPGSSIHGIFQARVLREMQIKTMRKKKKSHNETFTSHLSERPSSKFKTQQLDSAGEGNGTPLQYSCLENPMDGGAWWAAVHGVAKSQTRLTSLSLSTFMHWRRKWQPTPVFLPGESQGWGSLVGCRLWGRTESDTTEVT